MKVFSFICHGNSAYSGFHQFLHAFFQQLQEDKKEIGCQNSVKNKSLKIKEIFVN